MSGKSISKIFGYWIAWVLTIWWASVVITHDDVAEQYKTNTWKELTINENDLMSFEEALKTEKEERNEMQAMYDEIDCDKNQDYNLCTSFKSSLKDVMTSYDAAIDCDTRIVSKDNLEKSDLNFCIDAQKQLRDSTKNFYIAIDWSCESECQEEVDIYEYNIAMFQAYLNKLD